MLLIGFFAVRDLPLVDLPQHALQISRWCGIDAARADAANLVLNFRTPYLLAYPIVRALAAFLPVLTALKLVLWASVVALAAALGRLCRELGHEPWLGLLGYPLGLGFGFCFGFVAFCAALPLAYLAFAQLARHRRAPGLTSGAWLALSLALLLVAHGVALAFFVLVASPLLLGGGGKLWQRAAPLLSPLVLGAAWLAPSDSSARVGVDYFGVAPERWLELPGQLVGIGAADAVATGLGLALLLAVALSLGRPRPPLEWSPLVLSLLGYGVFPALFRGAGPFHPRFAAYLVPALLFAFSPRRRAGLSPRRALTWCVAASTLLVFCARLRDFQREAGELRALLDRLPAGLAVRPLVFERGSRAFPGIPAHLHLPAYYSVDKGGSPGYSFAMYAMSVVRFRPGARVLMSGGSEWFPERFDAALEAADYDYFIVKSSVDRGALLFPGPRPAATLDQHVGQWWGYRRPSPSVSASGAHKI